MEILTVGVPKRRPSSGVYYRSEFIRNRFVMIRGRFSGGLPEAFFGIVFLDLSGTDFGMNFGFVFFGAFFGGLGPKGLGGNCLTFVALETRLKSMDFQGNTRSKGKVAAPLNHTQIWVLSITSCDCRLATSSFGTDDR